MINTTVDPNKYILVDSSRRNRLRYPDPANMVIPYSSFNNSGIINVVDPIMSGFPIFSNITAAGSSQTQISLFNSATAINQYVGHYLEIAGESREIISFTPGIPATIVVAPGFSVAPGVAVAYTIRQYAAYPASSGLVTAVNNPLMDFVINSLAQPDGYYVGYYIRFTSGLNANVTRKITGYNNATNSITTAIFPAAVAINDTYEIYSVFDNSQPFVKDHSAFNNDCLASYRIVLTKIIIPNQPIFSNSGGTLINYPYITVEFHGVNSGSLLETIQSNNPVTHRAQFVVPVDPQVTSNSFFVLTGIDMVQFLKFRLTDDMVFVVRLPSGELLKFGADDLSPLPANPKLQITAIFELQRLVYA